MKAGLLIKVTPPRFKRGPNTVLVVQGKIYDHLKRTKILEKSGIVLSKKSNGSLLTCNKAFYTVLIDGVLHSIREDYLEAV